MLIQWSAGFRILGGLALVVPAAVMALAGCGEDSDPMHTDPPQALDQQTLEDMAAELEGRSFRQFHPSVDASPRRGVILDFHDGFRMWAQYAENEHAVYEWEITARSYRIESTPDGSGIALIPEGVTSMQQFPDNCSHCIPVAGVSISARDVLEGDEIAFRIDDPGGILPPPFPVFDTWTHFREDEVFH